MIQLKVSAFILAFIKIVSSSCGSYFGSVCCAGFIWKEETARCEKCPTGFYRTNCSERCKYPNFGEDCQGACACAEYLCNFVTGCDLDKHPITTEKLGPEKNSKVSTTFLAQESTDIKIIYKEIVVTKQSVIPSGGRDYFQMGIFILVGILVVFIGLFVAAYIYKQFHPKRNERKVKTHLLNENLKFKGLDLGMVETNEVQVFHNAPALSEPAYLQAVNHTSTHYEEVESKSIASNSESEQLRNNTNSVSEDEKSLSKENTYLSPKINASHIYVEVEQSSDSPQNEPNSS